MDVQGQACTEAIVALRRHDMLGFTVNKLLVKTDHRRERAPLHRGALAPGRRNLPPAIHSPRFAHRHQRKNALPLPSPRQRPLQKTQADGADSPCFPPATRPFPTGRTYPGRALCRSPHPGYNNAAKRSRRRKRTRSCILPRKRPAMPAKSIFRPFDPAFLTDRRDRKVAARSRWVFALGALSGRLLRRLTRLIHI